ncbi:ATP-binding cassette domain-containing protein [Solimonas terrae]|uniref:ATP-binding cassette domain-containing protein n=1 Tax=Solimonas terrae TaxID=1396819 RepID=A0A6M2BMM4_9GAMM|nr:ATP-binding cassette domain-containing protein [Solimonas terrae]
MAGNALSDISVEPPDVRVRPVSRGPARWPERRPFRLRGRRLYDRNEPVGQDWPVHEPGIQRRLRLGEHVGQASGRWSGGGSAAAVRRGGPLLPQARRDWPRLDVQLHLLVRIKPEHRRHDTPARPSGRVGRLSPRIDLGVPGSARRRRRRSERSLVSSPERIGGAQRHYALTPSRLRQAKGLIEVRDLSFRYADNLPYLYQGFDLRVEPGRIVAVMGPSGSGKSTLAKLLLGFYLPTGGLIHLDGTDIRHFSANELRNAFGVVPQETILFSGTLYDNLMMANPHATFEKIVHACKVAEIHDVIEQLPRGYQTEIGERGAGLSGGQKQRIAIARAILKQPKILIFDEATSSLDPATAEHFCATINQLKGKVTMLFIAHGLPKSLQVDEIVRIGAQQQEKQSPEIRIAIKETS